MNSCVNFRYYVRCIFECAAQQRKPDDADIVVAGKEHKKRRSTKSVDADEESEVPEEIPPPQTAVQRADVRKQDWAKRSDADKRLAKWTDKMTMADVSSKTDAATGSPLVRGIKDASICKLIPTRMMSRLTFVTLAHDFPSFVFTSRVRCACDKMFDRRTQDHVCRGFKG